MNSTFEKLKPHIDKQTALTGAMILFNWDNATLAPEDSIENTSKMMGILSDEYYKALINDEVEALLNELDGADLSEYEAAIVRELKDAYDEVKLIPQDEYSAYSALTSKGSSIWHRAKSSNDFTLYAPYLEEVIAYKKKFAGYEAKAKNHEGPLYDILLGHFEKGFTSEILDDFFAKLKDAILPLVQMVIQKNDKIDKSYSTLSCPVEKQREFSKFLTEYIGFDFKRGVLKESPHPFTTNLHNKDVRITTAYHENNFESALMSTIHETGHALYELHIDDALTMTPVGTGTSMGFHEGQSRLFENNFGRSFAFWEPIYDKLQKQYPDQLGNVSMEQFVLGLNKAQPGLIRTESDELTYCLHIMVRYEIEKMMINTDIDVNDLPKIWNDKYEEYLGIRPDSDANGIMQDIHWSGGDIGYFPSYAIGSAIAAQIYAHLKKAINVEECLKTGDYDTINNYLTEKIHRFGKSKTTNELLQNMMGEDFNPQYFVDYITEKYTRLYEAL